MFLSNIFCHSRVPKGMIPASSEMILKESRIEEYTDVSREQFRDAAKIGEIKFEDASESKLIVVTARAVKPLSERSGKKAQYDLGKKMLAAGYYDAGIFVFYDTRGSFRFSLIYPQYVGRRKQWSNFRRFTYFVSPELTNKTFLTRIGDGEFSSLEKIKDAFSVEKVTKEFYEQYRKLFEALLSDLGKNRAFQIVALKNQISTSDFAKKLLGQIVFLYFLQKKGWLGVPQDKPWGDGDKNFISHLYKQAVKKSENFYNDYLEILFYDTLNNAHREGADPSFSKYFNCRIPFLNGGLFEPEYDWHGTKIYLENGVFENIFEVFDRYNFTVEEESPDDKEVAVDPEMLGKVFENLLDENLRKGKGTYYTPREIVHYMCRESLVNYLVSQGGFKGEKIRSLVLKHESDFSPDEVRMLDGLLMDIKACDPACGSGAFLVGMLNEIVNARLVINPAGSEYGLKKETIQNCIYGVDIDPGAVEIAKLRLWLSLVVDYELADIEPLPNLDYKIMCGNSLLEELIVGDESIELFDPKVLEKDKPKRKSSDKLMQMDFLKQDAEEYLKILRKLHLEYFHETDTQKKKIVRGRIEKIEMDFIQSSIDSRVKEIETQIKNLNMQKPEDRKKNAGLMKKKLEYLAIPSEIRKSKVRPYFLWHLNFFEVFQEKGGFDVVIANPPYVDSETMTRLGNNLREIYVSSYNSAKGNWDLFVVFVEQGIKLLKELGIITYIVPNKIIAAKYSEMLRNILIEKNIKELRDYSRVGVFKEADVYPVVFLIQNNSQKHEVNMTTMKTVSEILENKKIPKEIFYQDIYWDRYFTPEKVLKIIIKMSKFPPLVKYFVEISAAATVSEAYELKKIIRDTPSNNNVKKLINTGTIDKYLSLWGRTKTQYIKNSYLMPFVSDNDLRKFSLNRYDQSKTRKIIIAGMSKDLECLYDEGEYIAGKSTSIILENKENKMELKIALSILNSKLISFWFCNFFKSLAMAGGYLTVNQTLIGKIPISVVPINQEKELLLVVNKIIAITKDKDFLQDERKQNRAKEYADQIDQMVYKLYGLTEEEIKIVEGDSRTQNTSELVKNRLAKAGSV